jgi:hypothetical protein
MPGQESKKTYVAVFKEILTGWLGWPEERFRRCVQSHDADLEDRRRRFSRYLELVTSPLNDLPWRLCGLA